MTKLRILNLGAGVQSTTLYLWAVDGLLPMDHAIFADTGDEPAEVYRHLEFLQSLNGPPITVVRACETSLGDNLSRGMNSTGHENSRHVAIPTFLLTESGDVLLGRRQCTKEYKIVPIDREVRKLIGLEPGERAKSCDAIQIIGLSFDEPKRVAAVRSRFDQLRWSEPSFPLFDEFMTRQDCVTWLEKRLPGYTVPRSACVFCPFKSDDEWLRLKSNPADWNRAVEIDNAIRDKTSAAARGMNATQYLHRSCKPLAEIDFKPREPDRQKVISFSAMDCEGMCGT